MPIKKIMCCCGGGMGSSLLIRINVQKVLEKHHIQGIEVVHSSLSDATVGNADLFVVGGDLETFVEELPCVITLHNIVSLEELEKKLMEVLANDK